MATFEIAYRSITTDTVYVQDFENYEDAEREYEILHKAECAPAIYEKDDSKYTHGGWGCIAGYNNGTRHPNKAVNDSVNLRIS